MPCQPAHYPAGMSEAAASSAWERVKRAKLREIEAHQRAINVHTSTAACCQSIGQEAQAAVVRQRAEHARVMLEIGINEAEALPINW